MPRLLTDAELDEIEGTRGCSFGEEPNPYWVEDLLHTAKVERRTRRQMEDLLLDGGGTTNDA